MPDKNNAFSDDYAQESSTDAVTGPGEQKEQAETTAGRSYDKSKPHRVVIRAKEVD